MNKNQENAMDVGIIKALDNRRWRLIVMPTEKCNFRCTYCYEKYEQAQMAPAIVSAIKKLLQQRAGELSVLELDWFGGEPLLAFSIMIELTQYAKKLGKQHNFIFRSSATTNGYLLDSARLPTLIEAGVDRFQISLDGFEADHNKTRLLQSGGGTFDRTWANLRAAAATDLSFHITLRIHFSPTNLRALPRLIDEINQTFGGDKRFHVFFKGLARLRGSQDDSFPVFSAREQTKVQQELLARLGGNLPGKVVDENKFYICYASQPNALAIRPNGDLVKCTVAITDSRNHVGQINPDGSLTINQERMSAWFEGLAQRDPGTLACPHAFMESRKDMQSVP